MACGSTFHCYVSLPESHHHSWGQNWTKTPATTSLWNTNPSHQKSPASVQSVVPRGTRGRHEPAGEGPSLRVNCCCWFRNSIELVDLNHTTLMIIGWWVTCTALVEKLPSSHRGVSWDFFNRNAVLRVRMHSEVQNQPFLIHSGILNNGFIPGNSLWPFWQTETWLIVADQSPEKGWWCLCFFH